MRLVPSLAAGLLVLGAGRAAADTAAPGHQLAIQQSPAFGAATCTLPGGDLVTFDGLSVDRWTASGAFVANLGTLPAATFPSFAVTAPGGQQVVIGESSNHQLYLVQVDGSGLAPLVTVTFNYDAAFLPGGDLVVSAATGMQGPGNDLVRVTLSPPASAFIGLVDGPSGPVAVAADGSLVYATQSPSFPPPPGSTDVLRWSAAQVQAGGLTNANATVLATGFDGGSSLGFDPVGGGLYMAETHFGLGLNRIVRVHLSKAQSPVVVDGTDSIHGIELYRPGDAPGSFAPWQPDDGVHLRYDATDFFSRSDVVTVRPDRPELAIRGPGTTGPGPVTFTLTGGVPNGTFFLAACPQSAVGPMEVGIQLPTFLFVTAFDLSVTRRPGLAIPTDGNGNGSFTLQTNGQLVGLFAYQLIVGDALGTALGSSNAAQF